MVKKLLKITFLLSVSALVRAQSFDLIPDKENPYEGGPVQFYKDLNNVLIKNNFSPCKNRISEMFVAEIQVAEGKGEIMNKKNEEDCSSELFIKAFNEINKLEKWDSRPEKKKNFSIMFYPIDYFGNFKEGYTPEGLKKEAQFPGGIDAFKSELNSNVKKQKIKSTGKSAVIHFKINTEGDISQIIIESSDLNLEEKEKIIKAVEKTDKKWIPGTFRNTPVIFSHRLSLML